jgi:hypothetical protein
MGQKITVRNNQTLLDIAIQEAGSIEAAIDLIEQNNLSITDQLTPASNLEFTESVSNVDIKSYFKGNNLRPATGLSLSGPEVKSGISVWKIGVDFKISKS